MSWSTQVRRDSKDGAKAAIREIENAPLPKSVRETAASLVDTLPDLEGAEIIISTSGHFHQGTDFRGTSNVTISVSNVILPEGARPVTDAQIADAQGAQTGDEA